MDDYEIEPMESEATPVQEDESPWDSGFYETGSTRPPRDYAGILATLLALGIVLGGVVSALGLLNIRIFRNRENTPESTQSLLSFQPEPSETQDNGDQNQEQTQSATSDHAGSLELKSSQPGLENVPQKGGLSYQQIYKQMIPSVVSISCRTSAGTVTGTGVVMSSDGYLITNYHVIQNAQQIMVLLTDERTFEATLVGDDQTSDLAVLHIPVEDLTAAEFGDSSSLQVGDAVVAIGDPLGTQLRGTMTKGIISAINRDITIGGRTMNLIQTDAAMNTGNSGGPLVNCYGQVIGINTIKIGDVGPNDSVEGLGFAIPSSTVKEIVDQLLKQGYVTGRPGLGLSGDSVPSFYQYFYRYPSGLYITEVQTGSSAESVGIQPGDILTQLDGVPITSAEELRSALYEYEIGQTVQVMIYRDGWEHLLELTVVDAATGRTG